MWNLHFQILLLTFLLEFIQLSLYLDDTDCQFVITCVIALRNPPPPTCPRRVTERPLYFTLSVCTVCLRVCYQTRGAPKGQHAPLSRSCPSLFPPQETQITQFVCDLRFKASPLVNRCSWNFFRGGLRSEPEQRRGEADSANGYKDKWKNVDAWESHRQWKRMKERVHHLDRSLTMEGHN